jgi:hypothetical protein
MANKKDAKKERRQTKNQKNSSDEADRAIVKDIQVHRNPRYTKMKSEETKKSNMKQIGL